MTLAGNGLGNVYVQPDPPHLDATVRNLTDAPVTVQLVSELIPYDRPLVSKTEQLELEPKEARTVEALAEPVGKLGHYRVRVVADAGPAGRVDCRTNLALLAPDTRKKIDSPFGCWSKLWTDEATDKQRDYLKEKAGVAFLMGKHNVEIRIDTAVPDDAAAENIAKGIPAGAKVMMLGWEQTWTDEQTFTFPRVIAEGKPETLSKEVNERADKVAAAWRRVALAVRRLRPDMKLSLGNSAANFSVPLLERGFKHGVEFDYFGTEEGMFDATPEQPADAISNVSWWASKLLPCEALGYQVEIHTLPPGRACAVGPLAGNRRNGHAKPILPNVPMAGIALAWRA